MHVPRSWWSVVFDSSRSDSRRHKRWAAEARQRREEANEFFAVNAGLGCGLVRGHPGRQFLDILATEDELWFDLGVIAYAPITR